MDSINSFKGYGKVDEVEEQAFKKKTRKRFIIIIVSAIVLLTVIIGAVVGTLIHKNNTESKETTSTPTSPASWIKAVCSVTHYPDSCYSSITALENSNKTDPEEIFKLSLQVAINELSKLSSLPDKFIAEVNDTRVKAALRDCKTLFEYAIDELNTSISSMNVGPGEDLLSASKIGDIKTWLSSAITDQETCLDGLIETKAAILDEIKAAMKNSTEFSSNSLVIVTQLYKLLDDLGITIHKNRKLLGFNSDFPEWVNPRDRRLLQENDKAPDLTVSQDGSGNFKTINEAVAVLGKKNKTRVVIYVKAGTYVENVILDKQYWNIMMYGDGMTETIVSGSLNFIDGTNTFATATFTAAGMGFIAKDMGFINTAGPEKHQAVALRSGSDHSVFYRCMFDAYQDTLYTHSGRQFYRDCDIRGTIDFIFGSAAVVFQNCIIQPRQPMANQFNTITAQGKKEEELISGISIQRCTIKPLDNVTAPTYLGRPWKAFSTTVIMESSIGDVVDPTGWIPWVPNTEPPSTIFYAEYQNTGPGAGLAKRVNWTGYKSMISDEVAAKFTVGSFIDGAEWIPQTNVMFESS